VRGLVVRCDGPLNAADLETQPYPDFPTDLQAQYMAMMTAGMGSVFSATTKIVAKATEHTFAMQKLPPGPQKLEAWLENGGSRTGVRFVEITRIK
jgi:UDP-N-acetylglucosamine enolpyruvyl transferase